jgi:UDP-N-acetylmuramoyl-tripeptide--D-alanyl-D-alanine ligase
MNIEDLYGIYQKYPSVQTDTRQLRKDDLFFALKGPHYNANSFAHQAIENGAAYSIVDEKEYAINERIILVDDVLKALQELALYHRGQFDIPFIAITGSNGKTTTKELVHAVLSTSFTTYTTQGNLNNHIGIPLTILNIKKDAAMAVIEMGANHLKEIEAYCTYTLPTYGIITNCGKAHLEGFGSYEAVKKGKGELYDHLRQHKGTAFVMWDYDYLQEMSKGILNIITYGTTEAEITGNVAQSKPHLDVEMLRGTSLRTIHTKLVGEYNLPNILAAVAVGKYFHVEDDLIKKALEEYRPSNSRSQLIEKNGNKFILDAYNANPSSMKAAIENLAKIEGRNKILMLGGMAELGAESLEEHQKIIDIIQQYDWKDVVLVGGDFLKLRHPFTTFQNASDAGKWLKEQHLQNDYILIKGSRSMQMEKVIE